MQIPDKVCIIILSVTILILSLTGYWRFTQFDLSLIDIKLPEIETPETNLEDFLPSEKEGCQKWTSPDNKLKFQYPANWTGTTETFLEYFDQAEMPLLESEVLFFAYQIDIKKQIVAILTVSEIDIENNLEEIIEKIKQDTEEQGGKAEVVNVEDEEKNVWLEIISEYPNQSNFFSKGKLLFTENKTYLIIITTPQKDWSQFKEKVDEIFDSIQLL